MAYSFWKEFARRELGRWSPARRPARRRTGSPGGFCPLYSWGPEDCLAAPLGPPPPTPFGGTPLRHHPPCGGRSREERSPSPMDPGRRPTKCRVCPGAACTIMFNIRKSCKRYHELFWYPNTYDFAGRLVLSGHSSSSSLASGE